MEFCNKKFDDLCASYGFMYHRTVRHNPQQNGVTERINKTIMDKVRWLIVSYGIHKLFKGEAVSMVDYLINRSSSTASNFKTPIEMWSSSPLDLLNLRVFGCVAFAHQKEGKVGPRSKKSLFRYPCGIKGYRVWLRVNQG